MLVCGTAAYSDDYEPSQSIVEFVTIDTPPLLPKISLNLSCSLRPVSGGVFISRSHFAIKELRERQRAHLCRYEDVVGLLRHLSI